MKKLIVFCDGTWNSADQKSGNGQPCPTNVARLFEATCQHDSQGNLQLVHYIRGVGTRKDEKIRGGGFGYGMSDNIKEGYQFICSNYEEGDQIFLFGFSRGAFAARSIAGFIHNLGILRRPYFYKMNEAYERYRDKSEEWKPDSDKAKDFQSRFCWSDKRIHFVGVWDTVGALGAPFGIVLDRFLSKLFKFGFHDTKLSSSIQSAYHALAINEHRWPFRPTRWELHDSHRQKPQNFQERWFPGAHSDIGGGYPDTGLSDVCLQWVADSASVHGMKVDFANIVSPPFSPNLKGQAHNSQTWYYRLGTIAFVKLPAFVGLSVPGESRTLITRIDLKGDFHRPNP